jgi:acyl-CoA synthetase (AMP-forming)/AMP-acid ligase II
MTARALGKMLFGNILATAAIRYRDKEAFYCTSTGRRFTFGQTNERCNRLASALHRLGLAKGDVAAFLCSNRAEVPEIYFALAKTGLVGIPLNYRLAPTEMIELMRAMGAKALLYEARFASCAEQTREQLPSVAHFVSIGGTDPGLDTGYEVLLAAAESREPTVEVLCAHAVQQQRGHPGIPTGL